MVAVGIPVGILEFFRGLMIDLQIAGGILVETSYYVEQRGLSAARLPQDRDEFALSEFSPPAS